MSATQAMLEESSNNPNLWTVDYIGKLGIGDKVRKATRHYAEWSVAAEYRMPSSKG